MKKLSLTEKAIETVEFYLSNVAGLTKESIQALQGTTGFNLMVQDEIEKSEDRVSSNNNVLVNELVH